MPQISSILFLLSAYGWGCACRALCDRRILRFHSLTAVVGLGILSFVGGLLNLAGCATALVLFVLLAAGVLVAALDLLKTRPWRDFSRTSARSTANSARKQRHKSVFLVLLAALPGIVACFLLMPTSVFNLYDDFHTYVTRVVRMAQTGSVGGNVFDNSGLDGLGSQSFFQGFFLFGTDIRLLNGFDAVACFSLCLLLTAELSVRWRLPFFTGTLAILCLVVINPQYVNISPLYSGVLLVMSLILCGAVLAGSLLNDRLRRTRGLEMVTSLFATLLVTLKVTLAVFAVFDLLCLYLILLATTRNRVRTIQSAFRVIGFSTLAILPWVLVHLPGVLRAGRIGVQWASTSVIAARYDSLAAREIPDLFSVAPSQYGNNPLAYDFLVGSLICAGVASLLFIRGNRERVSRVQFPSVAAAAIALVAVCFLNAHLFAIDTAVRYSCPTIIGCFVMTLVCWLRHIHRPYPPNLRQRAVFVSTCFVVAIIVFAGNFRTRAFNAATNRTLLAFPIPPYYANHSLYFISSGELAYARSLQFKTQPASGVLVWEVAPFNLDFRRNPLYTVSESGLINPALRFPAGLDVAALRRYLCAMGIRYILLEVRGAFVRDERSLSELLKARAPVYRKLAEYGIYFRQSLARLAEQNRILYSDDRMLLFELADAGLRAPQ